MISQAGADTGRMPTHDPFVTRDAMLGWLQDIAPYGIFTTDTQGVIRSWNQWLVTHSGLAAEAVIGRALLDVFPDLRPRHLDGHYARALHGEVSMLSTALHRYLLPLSPTAQHFGVDRMLQTARIAPLPGGDGIVGTITIIEDVTQRECQARSLRRRQVHGRLLAEALALLLQSEQPVTVATTLYQRIAGALELEVYWNFLVAPGGTELQLLASAGLSPEAQRSLARPDPPTPAGDATPGPPGSPAHLPADSAARPHAVRALGLRCHAAFPLRVGERWLGTLAFGSRLRDAIEPDEVEILTKLAQYVATAFDRAQRENDLRDAQQRLQRHAGELEEKIAERTAKLHDIIEQLERFSSTVAHDLRAPIRSLMGFSEILLTEFGDGVPPDARSLLERLHRAGQRLDALTRDLLKFSRIVGAEVILAPVEVDELLQDIVAATPALQAGVLTARAPLGRVRAQRLLLQQCLPNLFDNALKFTPPGVPPRISVRSERGGARLRLWIEDNGIGIPPQAHAKIFGIFERIPGLVPVEGTGIGLAIVARATAQMRGTCGVESASGAGSRFWLEFPAAD